MTNKYKVALLFILAMSIPLLYLANSAYVTVYTNADMTIVPTYKVGTVYLGSGVSSVWVYQIPRKGDNYELFGSLVTVGNKVETFTHQIYLSSLPPQFEMDGVVFSKGKALMWMGTGWRNYCLDYVYFGTFLLIVIFGGIIIIDLYENDTITDHKFFIKVFAIMNLILLSLFVYNLVGYGVMHAAPDVEYSGHYYMVNDNSHLIGYKYAIHYTPYVPHVEPASGYSIYSKTDDLFDVVYYVVPNPGG